MLARHVRDRVVVITGASAGIGAALAAEVAARGGRPVLVARREDALSKACARCGDQALAVVGDVTLGENSSVWYHAVLRGDINRIVGDLNANIHGQLLATDPHIGYLIMDLDQDVSRQVRDALADLGTSIRTRILY